MLTSGMVSSVTAEWETPQDLFDRLDREFCFELDACATAENAKCAQYFTKEHDGLRQEWLGCAFVNPPYGRAIGKWCQKSYEASTICTVVMLIPARTDTRWWHDWIMRAAEIRFIRGRLKFGNSNNSAPFPSAIVVFRPGHIGVPVISSYPAKGGR